MSTPGAARSQVVLAPYTTFGIGGPAQYFIEADTDSEVQEAAAFAQRKQLPLFVLGGGSNLLVPDKGVAGVVLHIRAHHIQIAGQGIVADAGAVWDTVVDKAAQAGLGGIENLAGIPGTIGGAAVQNIGAYGVEFSAAFAYADVFDTEDAQVRRITKADVSFGYRTSFFKRHRHVIVLRVGLALASDAPLHTHYADLVRARERGVPLESPAAVARAVRAIRADKFPDLTKEGTAGSFFKNPVVALATAAEIQTRFEDVPVYPQSSGEVKLSLAWLLDHAMHLKGYRHGNVRLFEKQPLVLVADGGTSEEVEALAAYVQRKVLEELHLSIEREVETFGAQ